MLRSTDIIVTACALLMLSCGTSTDSICHCDPDEPASADYRHDAKHVSLPAISAQDITVATILGWPVGPELPTDAPRAGRELQMFHIAHAYLQHARVNPDDCDLHLEVSDSRSKTAPRVIMETPIEESYCSARIALSRALKAKQNVELSPDSGEIDPVPVEVRGLAFLDFEHKRGTQFVQTLWELHPAVVTVLPK
jgi:hypothetical protein